MLHWPEKPDGRHRLCSNTAFNSPSSTSPSLVTLGWVQDAVLTLWRLTDWLSEWASEQVTDSLTDRAIDSLTCWLTDRLTERASNSLALPECCCVCFPAGHCGSASGGMDAHTSSHSLSRKRRRDDSNGETEEGNMTAKLNRHTVVMTRSFKKRDAVELWLQFPFQTSKYKKFKLGWNKYLK